MPFLTQHRFPELWRLFQYAVGGTIDKRRLCLKHFQKKGRILEVGCSIGNISEAFLAFPDVQFTGIDIDPVVVEYAKKRFRPYPNFEFICENLKYLGTRKRQLYDYIVFAGVCHHVNDHDCHELLISGIELLSEGNGRLVVVDPLLPETKDPWFVHRFLHLEQGQHLRTGKEMREILQQVLSLSSKRLKMGDSEECLIGASPLHWPTCARFGVYLLCT